MCVLLTYIGNLYNGMIHIRQSVMLKGLPKSYSFVKHIETHLLVSTPLTVIACKKQQKQKLKQILDSRDTYFAFGTSMFVTIILVCW